MTKASIFQVGLVPIFFIVDGQVMVELCQRRYGQVLSSMMMGCLDEFGRIMTSDMMLFNKWPNGPTLHKFGIWRVN